MKHWASGGIAADRPEISKNEMTIRGIHTVIDLVPRPVSRGAMALALAAIAAATFARTSVAAPAKSAAVTAAASFAALPQASDLELSPAGNLLAWQVRTATTARVVVYDLAARALKWAVPLTRDEVLDSLGWADDDTLLVTVRVHLRRAVDWRAGRYFLWYRTLAVNVTTGKSRMMTSIGYKHGQGSGTQLLALHGPMPHTVVMNAVENEWHGFLRNRVVSQVFQVNTRTGATQDLARGDRFTVQWVIDAQGEPVARSEWWHENGQRHFGIVAKQASGWHWIYKSVGSDFDPVGLDPTGKAILALESATAAKPGHLWEIPLDGSAVRDVLPGENVTHVFIYDRPDGSPAGVEISGASPKIHWFTDSAKLRYDSVAHVFPGRSVRVSSVTPDGRRAIATVQDASSPPVYYLMDFGAQRAMAVAEAYPQLDHVRLGTVKMIGYPNGKGATVGADVILPPGTRARKLPLVVLVPGGSEIMGMSDFDWLAQYLATQGYAVLRLAASAPYLIGQGAPEMGAGSWAGALQGDLTRGVDTLVQQGTVDPKRVCIVGVDDGAYAAFAGAASRTFACAVGVNGISDFPAMFRYLNQYFHRLWGLTAMAQRELGAAHDPKVAAASPINWVSHITVPVLLLHSVSNIAVPLTQSQEMDDALTQLRKPVTFIKLDGADYMLDTFQMRLQVSQDIANFLRKYLK